MLMMVTAKPMHVVMVMAEPRTDAGALAATNAENCGESAATIQPQKIMKVRNNAGDNDQINGETRQQTPDAINAPCAIFLLPSLNDIFPPTKHPTAPAAMMMKESNASFPKAVLDVV